MNKMVEIKKCKFLEGVANRKMGGTWSLYNSNNIVFSQIMKILKDFENKAD